MGRVRLVARADVGSGCAVRLVPGPGADGNSQDCPVPPPSPVQKVPCSAASGSKGDTSLGGALVKARHMQLQTRLRAALNRVAKDFVDVCRASCPDLRSVPTMLGLSVPTASLARAEARALHVSQFFVVAACRDEKPATIVGDAGPSPSGIMVHRSRATMQRQSGPIGCIPPWAPENPCRAWCPECLVGRCMQPRGHQDGHWCANCGYAEGSVGQQARARTAAGKADAGRGKGGRKRPANTAKARSSVPLARLPLVRMMSCVPTMPPNCTFGTCVAGVRPLVTSTGAIRWPPHAQKVPLVHRVDTIAPPAALLIGRQMRDATADGWDAVWTWIELIDEPHCHQCHIQLNREDVHLCFKCGRIFCWGHVYYCFSCCHSYCHSHHGTGHACRPVQPTPVAWAAVPALRSLLLPLVLSSTWFWSLFVTCACHPPWARYCFAHYPHHAQQAGFNDITLVAQSRSSL